MLLGGPDEIRDSHIETIVNMTTNRGGHGNCRNADVDFVSRDRSAPRCQRLCRSLKMMSQKMRSKGNVEYQSVVARTIMYERETHVVHASFETSMLGQPLAWLAVCVPRISITSGYL